MQYQLGMVHQDLKQRYISSLHSVAKILYDYVTAPKGRRAIIMPPRKQSLFFLHKFAPKHCLSQGSVNNASIETLQPPTYVVFMCTEEQYYLTMIFPFKPWVVLCKFMRR